MRRSVNKADLEGRLADVLRQCLSGPVQIDEDGETVAVVISAPEYYSLTEQRSLRGLEALHKLQEALGEPAPMPVESVQDESLQRKAS